MSRADLLRYWPPRQAVIACVKTDAEAANEAVSLAVHQQMQFKRDTVGAKDLNTNTPCSEQDILKAFLAEELPDGRVIIPIVGSSGVGKSHVIRWLYAQLLSLPDRDRRVVIRIPKGKSLKGVLDILLNELHGPEFDVYRQALARAQQELDAHEAAGLLCEMLAHTLEEMAVEAAQRLRETPGESRAQEDVAYCRALPTLLRNQTLRDEHFVRRRNDRPGVAARLVEHLTVGREAGDEDDRQHQFWPEDLIFDAEIDRQSLGIAEQRAMAHLDREDRRNVAATILTRALDDAKQRLLRIDPTVSDLFEAVRRELLAQRKELVLLVEDFAVLSGVQKQLLQVVIKEAVRDGCSVLCTMRTALAYTKGYPIPETVLTRAGVVYEIPDEPWSEEVILEHIERLLGAYLNAARIGQIDLERAYDGNRIQAGRDEREWIPRYVADVEPDARATLDDFGLSVDKYELFPFNVAAIDVLAREGCVDSKGQLIYNPRFVIQNIINRVLDHRDLFAQGIFPPDALGSKQVPAGLTNTISRLVPPETVQRYLRFLAYWGGSPLDLSSIAATPSRCFEAFELQKRLLTQEEEREDKTEERRKNEKEKEREKEREKEKRKGPHVSEEEARFGAVLEDWRNGIPIGQRYAKNLRKWVCDALATFVNWDWELFKPRKESGLETLTSWLFIPAAYGNEGRTAREMAISLCEETSLRDEILSARIQARVMAVVRFHGIYRNSWDYDGAEEDLPRYAALVDMLAPPAQQFVRDRYFRAKWDPTPALVQLLLIGARVLGIDSADKDDHVALVNALFTQPSRTDSEASLSAARDASDMNDDWVALLRSLSDCREPTQNGGSLIFHLLQLVGARQGQADIVHAVDVARLRSSIDGILTAWDFTEDLPDPRGVPEFAGLRSRYMDLRRKTPVIEKTRQRLVAWQLRMMQWLGEDDLDKEALIQELKGLADLARANNLTGGCDTRRLVQLAEMLRQLKVKVALDEAKQLGTDAPRGRALAILGHGHLPTMQICDELMDAAEMLMQAVGAELVRENERIGKDPMLDAIAIVRAELTATQEILQELRP